MSERLLNAAEVAELLAVPESWVREHTRNGSLPHLQLGRYIRYRSQAVLKWIESLENTGRRSHARPYTPRTWEEAQ
jgi:excisionase family DNA binding protein